MTFSLKLLFKNSSIIMLGGISQKLILAFQGIVVARSLGPSALGLWSAVVSFCAMIRTFLEFPTKEPLTRYMVEYKQEINDDRLGLLITTAIITDFITRVISFFAVFLIAPWWITRSQASTLEYIHLYWLYAASGLFTCLDAVLYCVARDQKKFSIFVLIQLIFTILQFLGIIVLDYFQWLTVTSLSVTFVGVTFIRFLAIGVYLSKALNKNYNISLWKINWLKLFDINKFAGFWKFMGATYLSSTMLGLKVNGDIVVLDYFVSSSEVGLYRVAKSMSTLFTTITQSFSTVIYQDFNEIIVSQEMTTIKTALTKVVKFSIPIASLLVIISMLLDEPFIKFAYGSQFAPAYVPFRILVIGSGVSIGLFWCRSLILALDDYLYYLIMTFTSSILFLLGMFFIVPILGIVGASIVFAGITIIAHLSLLVRAVTKVWL